MPFPPFPSPRTRPYLSVIVPAYNEALTIVGTLERMCRYLDRQPWGYEVIVSADGEDGTRERAGEVAAENARVTVIGSLERGGKGRGIRNGVARASGVVIGFVDADYKTPIEEFDKLLPWLRDGWDMAIGSRAVAGSEVEVRQPLYRRLGSRVFGGVVHTLMGLGHVHDTQCGFKFFQAAVARDLFARQRVDGYMFDVEILRLAKRAGYRIKEVGVRWRDDGDSRYDPVAGTWKNLKELARIRLMRYPQAAPAPAPVIEAPADAPTALPARPPIRAVPRPSRRVA